MLELRRRIDEVHPKVVVCEDEKTKEFATKLLEGLNLEISTLDEENRKSKLLHLIPKRAVWLGSHKPPKVGTCYFDFLYTGGVDKWEY